MDSLLGVGGPEFVLILVLALIALGPLRMLQAARTFGRLMRDLRRYYTDLMKGINQELANLDAAQESLRKSAELPPVADAFRLPPPPPVPTVLADRPDDPE